MDDDTQEGYTHPYAELGPEEVLKALETIGYEPDARIFALNSYENRVYQLGLLDGTSIIVKFYRPGRWTEQQIFEEHRFAQELADLEIPVVAPLKLNNGSTLEHYQNFQFSVFPQVIGRPPELDNLDNLLVMGRFVARIHAVGAMGEFGARNTLSPELLGHNSRNFLLRNDFLPKDLVPAYETVSADLLSLVDSQFRDHSGVAQLRIHGDCHPGNVLWKDETPTFVDFDDTVTGPAMQDLWMMLSGDRNQRQGQLLELVEGYNEFYDFHSNELGLVESLRSLRLMNYSAWLARRWADPAFPQSFPWFNTERYWAEHILELREQLAAMDEPPLRLI
ncbi:MAG: serine/threonine protein kinase [Pseudohongiellaceae bacterium]